MQLQKINRVYVPYISLAGMLLALGGLGYLGFLAFVRNMLMPGEFAAYGLVITAVAAGTASFFSPCSFTVLPSYIAFASSGQNAEPGKRFRSALKNGVVAALGVVTVVAVLGSVIGILGTGIGASYISQGRPTAYLCSAEYQFGPSAPKVSECLPLDRSTPTAQIMWSLASAALGLSWLRSPPLH